MMVQQLQGIALGMNHAVVDSLRNAPVTELDAPAWGGRRRSKLTVDG